MYENISLITRYLRGKVVALGAPPHSYATGSGSAIEGQTVGENAIAIGESLTLSLEL